ncbi:hypothetical protein HOY82DRAFT_595705 [Tuber indicum]|nr:hypothetical protein HOY82DRAFT_595705 [Tuber indicum]
MTKHTGIFLTLKERVERYGADAHRIAFANTGDDVEDANFEEKTLKGWCEDMVGNAEAELQGVRDTDRETADTIRPHQGLIGRFVKVQVLLITFFAPAWVDAPFATEFTAAFSYVRTITSNLTLTDPAQPKRKVKGKSFVHDTDKASISPPAPHWHTRRRRGSIWTPSGDLERAHGIKRRLQAGPYKAVFHRKLVLDLVAALKEVSAWTGRVTSAVEVRVTVIRENGKGKRVDGGSVVEVDVPIMAENAEPGQPKFGFGNVWLTGTWYITR